MKIFLTNKDKFDDTFCHEENDEYRTAEQIHKALFCKISTDLINNKIEIIAKIPCSKIHKGNAVFEFIGKNREVFFYTFKEFNPNS